MPAGAEGSEVSVCAGTAPDAAQKSSGLCPRLWLQTPCEAENLWFLNRQHLDFVEAIIQIPRETRHRSFGGETHRERIQWIERWVEQAEDKGEILRCLRELRLKNER